MARPHSRRPPRGPAPAACTQRPQQSCKTRIATRASWTTPYWTSRALRRAPAALWIQQCRSRHLTLVCCFPREHVIICDNVGIVRIRFVPSRLTATVLWSARVGGQHPERAAERLRWRNRQTASLCARCVKPVLLCCTHVNRHAMSPLQFVHGDHADKPRQTARMMHSHICGYVHLCRSYSDTPKCTKPAYYDAAPRTYMSCPLQGST